MGFWIHLHLKNMNTQGNIMSTLQQAIREGRNRDVQLLIQEGLKQRETFVQCYDGAPSDVLVGSPLHDAVFANQLKTVKLLIMWGAKIDYIDPNTKETAIHWAARYGHLEVLKFFLYMNQGSMLIKDGTPSENLPIHTASYFGYKYIVEWLVSIGVAVDAVNKSGQTPLLIAVKGDGDIKEFVETLIALRADVNYISKDAEGMSPLHMSVRFGSEDTMNILLKRKADTQIYCKKYGFTPLHWAVRLGMLEKLQLIHSYDPDLSCKTNNVNGDEPVHLAAKFGQVRVMQWLFNEGCLVSKPNKIGLTPLHISVIFEQPDIVTFLVSIGIDLLERTSDHLELTALHIAAFKGLDDMVTLLLKSGAHANVMAITSKCFLPLHCAIAKNKVNCLEILFHFSGVLIKLSNAERCRALFVASYSDAGDCMRFLIRNGISVNVSDSNNNTALLISASFGCKNTTQILLENGADVNAQTIKKMFTPLLSAVSNGHYDIFALLLEFGADVNATCISGHNAAHFAAERGSQMCLQLLRGKGCNLNAQSTEGNSYSPIHVAAFYGRINVVIFLICCGVPVDTLDFLRKTPLYYAVCGRQYEVAELLLRNNADVNIRSNNSNQDTPLHIAAELGDARIINLFIENGALLELRTLKEETPLLSAAKNGRSDAMSLLAQAGADVFAKDNLGLGILEYEYKQIIPLYLSASCGSKRITKILLENGANVNARTIKLFTPLFYAVANKHYEISELLLKFGADVNASCINEFSIAHCTVSRNDPKSLQLLISAGCDLNVHSKAGISPIHFAAIRGRTEMVHLLVKNGVPVDALDNKRRSPLFHTIHTRNYEVAEFLLRNNADMNMKPPNLNSPLHEAARLGDVRLIKLFIENGAALNSRNSSGLTALDYAVNKGHVDVVKELIPAGADGNATDNLGREIQQFVGTESMIDNVNAAIVNAPTQ
ncbi:hypothetical protein C0J52_20527 [Blattella germanica]|nr:hypothetical protein C0J52_20527 [Blattella germanica]